MRAAALLVLAAALAAAVGAAGQGPVPASAPSASSDCFTVVLNMSDCLTYVEAGSNLTRPGKGCCPELASLVDNNPICLCSLVANASVAGVKIDVGKATRLPAACSVTTPPISLCAAAGYPVPGPSSSPGPMSPGGAPMVGPAATSPASGNNSGSLAPGLANPPLPFLTGLALSLLPALLL